ncbi:MAG: hypothetical protein QXS13_01400 [Acidilobaceae archaeon]
MASRKIEEYIIASDDLDTNQAVELVSWRRAFEASVILVLMYLVVMVLGGTMLLTGMAAMTLSRALIPIGVLLMFFGYLIILLGAATVIFKMFTDLVGEEVEDRLITKIDLIRREIQSLSKLAERREGGES